MNKDALMALHDSILDTLEWMQRALNVENETLGYIVNEPLQEQIAESIRDIKTIQEAIKYQLREYR